MLEQNLWGEFELIEVNSCSRQKGYITISKSKNVLNIASKFMKQLPWADEERVNLYRLGETFALRPHKVGLIRVRRHKNGGSQIPSTNLCLEILSRSKSCMKFEGWVEEDTLFFKPVKGEEE